MGEQTESPARGADYRDWLLRQRLKLLAFDARLAGVPLALLNVLWKAIDRLGGTRSRSPAAVAI